MWQVLGVFVVGFGAGGAVATAVLTVMREVSRKPPLPPLLDTRTFLDE